jgi:hypothetical protein
MFDWASLRSAWRLAKVAADEVRLGLGQRAASRCLGHRDLRIGGLGLRLDALQLSLRLGDPGLVVAVVQLEEDVAFLHRLVLDDRNRDHLPAHVRRERHHVRVDLGVVGGLLAHGEQHVEEHPEDDHPGHATDDHQRTALPRLRTRRPVLFLGVAGLGVLWRSFHRGIGHDWCLPGTSIARALDNGQHAMWQEVLRNLTIRRPGLAGT